MADLLTELKERRVLPAVGVYAGGCWVMIEILDRLVERYLLSPYLTDIVFWGLYSMIPAVVLVAWSYGRPGKDKATTAQKVGVPINVIATIGLLLTLFSGKDLGVTANRITVANEEGVPETHIVPREGYRRRLAVFFYTNESGDQELDWLSYAAAELLTQDLVQDPFVLATSPWANWGNGYYARMRAAGFDDGLDLPRSLMREIADDANRQYFVEGSVDRASDEYVVTTRLWDVRTMSRVNEFSVRGWDYLDLFDRTSRKLREALDVPDSSRVSGEDLPLAETYGESEQAFRHYIRGLNERLFNNDVQAANAWLDKSVAADPGFVLAHYIKAVNLVESGDLPGGKDALQHAQALDYRLPSVDRAHIRALSYRLAGQSDKMIEFLRLQVRLRDDAASHSRLGNMLMVSGELEEAKAEFRRALERDSLNLGVYLVLSLLERATGNIDAAVEYASSYQKERPEDMEAQLQLGDLLRDTGNLDQAEAHYLQGQLLEDQTVAPVLRLAIIAARRGDEKAARSLLEEAEAQASTPTEMGAVRQAVANIEMRAGRISAAIEQLYAAEEFLKQSQPPMGVALATYSPLVRLNLHLNDVESAERTLAAGLVYLQPPMDQFLSADRALIDIARGDLEGAERSLAEHREIVTQFKLEALNFQASLVEALLLDERNDHGAAIEAMQLSLDQIDRSFIAAELYSTYVPTILAELASLQVSAGDTAGAQATLEHGFRLDPSHPGLWLARARLQYAAGTAQLALASVNYALAIWAGADPEYDEYRKARALADEITLAVGEGRL